MSKDFRGAFIVAHGTTSHCATSCLNAGRPISLCGNTTKSMTHDNCDARPTVILPAVGCHHPLASTYLYSFVTEARVNNLPNVAKWQWNGPESEPWASSDRSDTLTTSIWTLKETHHTNQIKDSLTIYQSLFDDDALHLHYHVHWDVCGVYLHRTMYSNVIQDLLLQCYLCTSKCQL